MSERTVSLTVNGKPHQVLVEPHWTLQRALLFRLGLTGSTKTFCDHGECGACTVIVDGRPVLSCVALAVECEGKSIETIEGIAESGHPLMHAYMNGTPSSRGQGLLAHHLPAAASTATSSPGGPSFWLSFSQTGQAGREDCQHEERASISAGVAQTIPMQRSGSKKTAC